MGLNSWQIGGKDIRGTRRVKLLSTEQYDGNFLPRNLLQAIEVLSGLLEDVPEELHDEVEIEFDVNRGYEESAYVEIEVAYTRDETDEEWAERKANVEAQMADADRQEIALLKALKAKYE